MSNITNINITAFCDLYCFDNVSAHNITNATNNTDPCFKPDGGDYNEALHIISIFVILITSWIGVSLPVLVSLFDSLKFARPLMFVGKFFGAGVIAATGFIHIFPDSVSALTDPCLPEWFSQTYTAAAGMFALLSALFMHLVEWLALNHDQLFNKEPHSVDSSEEDGEHSHTLLLEARKQKISTYTLEFGISIHSIIIGISLGVAKSEFVTLFIALIFHQFFEGVGLGSVLSELQYKDHSKPILMLSAVLYSFMTPTGCAIGIGIYKTSHNATQQLLVSGILDSISAGILIYMALVTLLGAAFSNKKFQKQTPRTKLACFIALYLGATGMAIIGIWA